MADDPVASVGAELLQVRKQQLKVLAKLGGLVLGRDVSWKELLPDDASWQSHAELSEALHRLLRQPIDADLWRQAIERRLIYGAPELEAREAQRYYRALAGVAKGLVLQEQEAWAEAPPGYLTGGGVAYLVFDEDVRDWATTQALRTALPELLYGGGPAAVTLLRGELRFLLACDPPRLATPADRAAVAALLRATARHRFVAEGARWEDVAVGAEGARWLRCRTWRRLPSDVDETYALTRMLAALGEPSETPDEDPSIAEEVARLGRQVDVVWPPTTSWLEPAEWNDAGAVLLEQLRDNGALREVEKDPRAGLARLRALLTTQRPDGSRLLTADVMRMLLVDQERDAARVTWRLEHEVLGDALQIRLALGDKTLALQNYRPRVHLLEQVARAWKDVETAFNDFSGDRRAYLSLEPRLSALAAHLRFLSPRVLRNLHDRPFWTSGRTHARRAHQEINPSNVER